VWDALSFKKLKNHYIIKLLYLKLGANEFKVALEQNNYNTLTHVCQA